MQNKFEVLDSCVLISRLELVGSAGRLAGGCLSNREFQNFPCGLSRACRGGAVCVYMMMNENENKTLFIVILFAALARLHKLRGGVCKSLSHHRSNTFNTKSLKPPHLFLPHAPLTDGVVQQGRAVAGEVSELFSIF
jgi:hypothetical protein